MLLESDETVDSFHINNFNTEIRMSTVHYTVIFLKKIKKKNSPSQSHCPSKVHLSTSNTYRKRMEVSWSFKFILKIHSEGGPFLRQSHLERKSINPWLHTLETSNSRFVHSFRFINPLFVLKLPLNRFYIIKADRSAQWPRILNLHWFIRSLSSHF